MCTSFQICPENKRDKPTLEMLISKRVKTGSHILTDGWSGYKDIERLGKLVFFKLLPKLMLPLYTRLHVEFRKPFGKFQGSTHWCSHIL